MTFRDTKRGPRRHRHRRFHFTDKTYAEFDAKMRAVTGLSIRKVYRQNNDGREYVLMYVNENLEAV